MGGVRISGEFSIFLTNLGDGVSFMKGVTKLNPK